MTQGIPRPKTKLEQKLQELHHEKVRLAQEAASPRPPLSKLAQTLLAMQEGWDEAVDGPRDPASRAQEAASSPPPAAPQEPAPVPAPAPASPRPPHSKLALKLLAMQRLSDEAVAARDGTVLPPPDPALLETLQRLREPSQATPGVSGAASADPAPASSLREAQAAIPAARASLATATPDVQACVLPVSQIEVRAQARGKFGNLTALAGNIEALGQIQAIVVCPLGENRYLLLQGERRLRAIRDVLGRDTILARIREVAPDSVQWQLAQLSENLQREDYPPLDAARAFARLLKEQQWTPSTLADELRISKSWMSKRLSLLQAPLRVQEAIEEGTLSETDYYHHRKRYDAAAETSAPSSNGQAASRTAQIKLPMTTALEMARLVRELVERERLAPVELSPRPTKQELLALFETRIRDLRQHLKSRTRAPGQEPD